MTALLVVLVTWVVCLVAFIGLPALLWWWVYR